MKKKFKEEELAELKSQLITGWVKNVGIEDGFEQTWQVVEDAARYSFNASHALSVAIDSLYGAYLKSHYPLEYFTVALSLYSDDMERTAELINELKYFKIKIKNVRFGKSGSEYMMDKSTNSIYKSITSIKYCNATIADELLELSKNKYNNFVELIKDINEKTSVNSRQLEILTGLGFFEEFGKNAYLLNIIKLCNGVKEGSKMIFPALLECKQLKKDKLQDYGISDYLAQKYSNKETAKMYSQIDNAGLLKELSKELENKSMNIIEQIKFELAYLEYVIYTNPKINKQYYCVIDYKTYKEVRKPYVTLYRLNDGEIIKTKIKSVKVYENAPFGEFSILKIPEFTMSPKTKMVNGEWTKTDELEPILTDYEVIK